MEKSNGSYNGSAKPMNGINGLATMNGHATKPRRKAVTKQGPGFLAWTFSLVARLFTWYSIVTLLFRCPASLDQCSESSPRICKPYFQLKEAVSPHLEPYYTTYAAPYVELARPYYETADQKVFTPAWTYANKYGGPRIVQAQAFGQTQWEKSVQPELIKYQALAKAKYDQTLAPHVDQISSTVSPYYEVARTNALQTYHELLLPSYVFVQPYAQRGYNTAVTFTTDTAIPSAAWAWNKTYVFLDGTVWPQLRFIYTENVEPQLQKIGQRLGRYNANNTQKLVETTASTAAKADSTVTTPSSSTISASSTPASSSATTSSVETVSSATPAPSSADAPVQTDSLTEKIRDGTIPAPEVAPDESDVRRTAREIVAQDLQDWQEKYAKAADEGAVEIDDRIDEISKRMVDRQVKTMGYSLLKQLRGSVESELQALRADIKQIVGQVKSGSETVDGAQEKIAAAVRRAGLEIKDKSVDVRNWSENYERELQVTVTKAAENHFKILDNIRDLALQKIGMKWAWMDGVTYKDWAKYHLLKDRFDEWEGDLKNLITSHPGLQEAEDAGRAIEASAMEVAQGAVKELAALKQIAGWKVIAQDDSDDFDADSTRLAAEEAAKAQVEAKTGTDDAEPTGAESTTSTDSASSSVAPGQDPKDAQDTPDLASTIILEETPVMNDNTTEATEPAEPLETNDVHLPVDEVDEPVQAELSSGGEKPEDAVDQHEAMKPTASIKSVFMGAAAQSVPSRQPILDEDNLDTVESLISAMQSDVPATISSAASSAYSAAMSGAADRYSQVLSLVSVQASGTPKPAHEELLASVTSAYGNAVAAASSRLDAALNAASGGIFATTSTNVVPALPTLADWARVESIAASRLSEGQAWAAEQYESAKVAIGLATPTPTDISGTISSVASVAGESASLATDAAAANIEKLYQNAQFNYYAGLGVAQERYSQFLAAASSALSSVTATPTPTDLAGTISSVASVASESAASVASVAGDNASSAAAAGYENVSSAADAAASLAAVAGDNASSVAAAGYENVASAANAAASMAAGAGDSASSVAAAGYDNVASAAGAAGTFASESWNAVLDQISVQVYGQPTPTLWYDSLLSTAGEYAASVTDAVGGGAGAATSAAATYAAAASDGASDKYAAVSSIVSELLVGKEPTFSESVYSRLAEAYQAASASATSFASVASETVASVATEATEAVKDATQAVKDEL